MIPIGFVRQRGKWGKCARILSATVLCSLVSVAYSATTVLLEQTPAQDRIFDSLFGGGGGWSQPAPSHAPPMNLPDVAGFGMYPLWKFHKFDGLSLRPVPYGVDIGSGIPPSPVPPAYPTGFLSSPSSPANPPYYGPPSNPPATNYEAAAPQNPQPSYGGASQAPPTYNNNAAPAQGYGATAPQQNYGNSAPQQQQSYGSAAPQQNYGMTSAPSYSPEAASSNNYPPNTINLSYQPVQQAPKYNDPVPSYNAPAAPSYGEPQAYGPPQSSYPMNSPSSSYDGVQYGSGSGITVQFAPAPQEYGMQQPNYGSTAAGSYQMPTYTSIESPMSASYPPIQDGKQMGMDSYGNGGFLKRSSSSFTPDTSAAKNSESDAANVPK